MRRAQRGPASGRALRLVKEPLRTASAHTAATASAQRSSTPCLAPPPSSLKALIAAPPLPLNRLHFRLKAEAVKAQAREWAHEDASLRPLADWVAAALDALREEEGG